LPLCGVKQLITKLTVRAKNRLSDNGIYNTASLIKLTDVDLLRLPGIDKRILTEIKNVLEFYGLSLNKVGIK